MSKHIFFLSKQYYIPLTYKHTLLGVSQCCYVYQCLPMVYPDADQEIYGFVNLWYCS